LRIDAPQRHVFDFYRKGAGARNHFKNGLQVMANKDI